ncbi:MAG: hypothetical protein Q9211_002457 [Gyalolechia sp. 1 TL-2023]
MSQTPSAVLELVALAVRVLKTRYASLARSYGNFAALLILYIIPLDIAAQHERVEQVILEREDDLIVTFKQAVTDECNMTAIAGAIIAQVAITALSLPRLSSTHWVARALFLLALASGCLSVYFCCAVQRSIGALYHPESIRNWLSLPRHGSSTRKASLAAILIISAPFNLMGLSIQALLTGLATYQGFTWTRGLDTEAGRNDSRAVFITFVVGTGACVLSYYFTVFLKSIENNLFFGGNTAGRPDPTALDNISGTAQLPPTSNQRLPSLPAVQSESDREGLFAALEAAARTHIQCAEAERRVASEYALAFQVRAHGI